MCPRAMQIHALHTQPVPRLAPWMCLPSFKQQMQHNLRLYTPHLTAWGLRFLTHKTRVTLVVVLCTPEVWHRSGSSRGLYLQTWIVSPSHLAGHRHTQGPTRPSLCCHLLQCLCARDTVHFIIWDVGLRSVPNCGFVLGTLHLLSQPAHLPRAGPCVPTLPSPHT